MGGGPKFEQKVTEITEEQGRKRPLSETLNLQLPTPKGRGCGRKGAHGFHAVEADREVGVGEAGGGEEEAGRKEAEATVRPGFQVR
jgi:hypothetical protein